MEIQHLIEITRAAAEAPSKISQLSDLFKDEMVNYNILPADLWNMDGMGVILGQRRSRKVIVAAGMKGQPKRRGSLLS